MANNTSISDWSANCSRTNSTSQLQAVLISSSLHVHVQVINYNQLRCKGKDIFPTCWIKSAPMQYLSKGVHFEPFRQDPEKKNIDFRGLYITAPSLDKALGFVTRKYIMSRWSLRVIPGLSKGGGGGQCTYRLQLYSTRTLEIAWSIINLLYLFFKDGKRLSYFQTETFFEVGHFAMYMFMGWTGWGVTVNMAKLYVHMYCTFTYRYIQNGIQGFYTYRQDIFLKERGGVWKTNNSPTSFSLMLGDVCGGKGQ